MRATILASSFVAICACGSESQLSTRDESTAVMASDAVRLVSATLGQDQCATGPCSTLGARIAVRNLAYDKTVEVVWAAPTTPAGGSIPARYLESSGDGWEIWEVPLWQPGSLPRIGQGVKVSLSARYSVAGSTYEDSGYQLAADASDSARSVVLGRNLDVAVAWESRAAGRGGYAYSIMVGLRNIAYAKGLDLVYSTDGWRTVAVAHGAWISGPGANDSEIWRVDGPQTGAFDFALAYSVGGSTHWDNNFSANYHVAP